MFPCIFHVFLCAFNQANKETNNNICYFGKGIKLHIIENLLINVFIFLPSVLIFQAIFCP